MVLMRSKLLLAFVAIIVCSISFADDDDSLWDNTRFSGFGTIAAGRVISGGMPSWTDRLAGENCPCLIADWAHAGVYTNDWSLKPESKLGLQVDTDFTKDLSATLQLVARSAPLVPQQIDVEWLYGTYKLDPNWTVQAGRKRLPIDYYSDFQDIGNAYIWVRPSDDVYGWDIVNFNGANITYHNAFDELSLNASLFAGSEHSDDYALGKIFTLTQYNQTPAFAPTNRIDADWTNIVGAHSEINYQWLTARAVYMQFDDQEISYATGVGVPTSPPRKREIYGYAVLANYDNWIFIHEYSYFSRRHSDSIPPDTNYITLSFSGGYRWDKLTGMLSTSSFRDQGVGSGNYRRTIAGTLRYDVTPHSDIKLQLDTVLPELGNGVGAISGRAKLATVAYDFTF